MEQTGKKVHKVEIQQKNSLYVSGVEDIESFNEENVTLQTEMGRLHICGAELKISKLNMEMGELSVRGEIDSILYDEQYEKQVNVSQGMFSRFFK